MGTEELLTRQRQIYVLRSVEGTGQRGQGCAGGVCVFGGGGQGQPLQHGQEAAGWAERRATLIGMARGPGSF